MKKISDKIISARIEENQSGNEDEKTNNCKKSVIVNNKSADEKMSELMTKMLANKKKHVRLTKRAKKMTITLKIHHYCPYAWGKLI